MAATQQDAGGAPRADTDRTPGAEPVGRAPRILVVDDEEPILRLMEVLVKRRLSPDAELVLVDSAEAGLAKAREAPFDLVVSDYRMKGRSGVDLLETIAQEAPGTARVLITAYSEMDIGVDAVNRGRVDGFVRKPWDNDEFVALMRRLLSGERSTTGAPALTANAALAAEIAEIEKALGKLKVRLGLGSISGVAFERMRDELLERKARLEARRYRS